MSTATPRRRNVSGGGSLRDTVAKRPAANPFEFSPRATCKVVGEKVRFRILSLHPDDTRDIKCAVAKRDNKGKVYNDNIHWALQAGNPKEVLKENDLNGLVDEQGNYLTEGKPTNIFRIPVFVYEKITAKGAIEPINELRYAELNWGQLIDIFELEKNEQLTLSFDEEMLKPMYDIFIKRAAESGEGTWEIIGIQNDTRNKKEFDVNYDVDDEDALGEYKYVLEDEAWGEVQDAMDIIQDMDQIRYILGTKKDNDRPNRPTMPEGGAEAQAEPGAEATRRRNSAAKAPEPETQESPEPEGSSEPGSEATVQTTGAFQRRRSAAKVA